ncbi:MAG: hypothetical protein ABR985_00660 [Methanotrichaceae archaeon]
MLIMLITYLVLYLLIQKVQPGAREAITTEAGFLFVSDVATNHRWARFRWSSEEPNPEILIYE